MKSFKSYITEEPSMDDDPGVFYVKVQNGKVHLCTTKSAGPCSTFGSEAVSAVIQGETIIVTTKSGKALTYKINRNSRTVLGPLTSY
jgi:hypothetical protein